MVFHPYPAARCPSTGRDYAGSRLATKDKSLRVVWKSVLRCRRLQARAEHGGHQFRVTVFFVFRDLAVLHPDDEAVVVFIRLAILGAVPAACLHHDMITVG